MVEQSFEFRVERALLKLAKGILLLLALVSILSALAIWGFEWAVKADRRIEVLEQRR